VYARANFEDKSGVIPLTVYSRQYEQHKELVGSDSILVVGGRVQVRSDGTREIVVDRMTRIDEVLGTWTRDILLEVDLEAAGRSGLEGIENMFREFGQPQPLRSLTVEDELIDPKKDLANKETPDKGTAEGAGNGGDPDADPEMVQQPVLARPVPLVIEVEREGKTWLLKSEGRNIALCLDSLRRLRQVPGASRLCLRASMPAPVEQKRRFQGRG